MLKYFLTIALLYTLAHAGIAQSHYFKGYLNTGIQKNPNYVYSDIDKKIITSSNNYEVSFLYQIGYAREKENNRTVEFLLGGTPGGWQTQYELGPVPRPIGNAKRGNFQFQNEFKRKKCFDEKRKSTVYIGWFYNVTWHYSAFESGYPTIYYTSSLNRVALRAGFMPGSQFNVGKRLVIDLNVAVSFVSMGIEQSVLENPVLSAEQRKSNLFSFDLPIETMLRLGVGYKLGKI